MNTARLSRIGRFVHVLLHIGLTSVVGSGYHIECFLQTRLDYSF